MKLVLCLYISVFSVSFSQAQPWLHLLRETGRDSITLLFSGDIMQHAPQIQGAWNDSLRDYNYLPCFQYIRPYWEQADYVIANLETTLANSHFSGYPQFCAPWQLARDLKQSGVDILTTNNNHSCDKGVAGIRNTLYYLDSLQISHTGTFTDTTSWISGMPFYIRHGSFKIALLSYTYGTNGIPVGQGQVVSMIDTLFMLRHIEKARLDTATHIIAFLHWGEEYHTQPNTEQQALARWLRQNGVEIVIGSHPHVVQPMEYVTTGQDTTGVIVYSLGNFISNQSKRYTNGGISVFLRLDREQGHTRYQLRYLSHYVHRPVENKRRRYYVIPEPKAGLLSDSQEAALCHRFFQDTDSIINGKAGKITVDSKF